MKPSKNLHNHLSHKYARTENFQLTKYKFLNVIIVVNSFQYIFHLRTLLLFQRWLVPHYEISKIFFHRIKRHKTSSIESQYLHKLWMQCFSFFKNRGKTISERDNSCEQNFPRGGKNYVIRCDKTSLDGSLLRKYQSGIKFSPAFLFSGKGMTKPCSLRD